MAEASPDISSARNAIAWLREEGDFYVVKDEVDPIYEVSGISKAFDGGPALLFEKIKGYPGHRIVSNLFSTRERTSKIFGVADPKKLKFKYLEAIRKPIPPRIGDSGPCQENVITKDIDVMATLPIIKHTEEDAGRILGGGNTFLYGPGFGSHVSFNRMHFQGKDWSSISLNLSSHFEHHVLERVKDKARVPVTINVLTPPAVITLAAGGMMHLTMPAGSDELGIAGGMQGYPVDICRAKTVDAWSIANAEWVIEGYVDTSQHVWESDEARRLEEAGQPAKAPFFPEYTGYLGRAQKSYKFQVTAITHRHNPVFYAPLASSIECLNLCGAIREASFYDIGNRICPGLVIDAHIPEGFRAWGGVVIQVKKRRRRDEGYQRNILAAMFAASLGVRIAIAVDEDVDIYDPHDILWALTTRAEPTSDLIVNAGFRGVANWPTEKLETLSTAVVGIAGSWAIDATVPFGEKWKYKLGEYPKVDLSRWFTPDQIQRGQALQTDYARLCAQRRS
ncbi:MAG: UbiD family decarboxylase [Chloroflexi bacterium]|nr:UbiD family decarboxylase [Chloroflexota bacterium]